MKGARTMTTTIEEPEQQTNGQQVARYSPTEAAIADMRERYLPLVATTPEGYEAVRRAIGELRTSRTSIEKRRVALNADALDWQRKVNAEAKRLTGLLLEIEDPLKERKAAVDDAKEREKRSAEIAAREAEEAKLRAILDAEAARLAEERARLAEERKALEIAQVAERERQRQEKSRADAERTIAERLQAEARERLDAERRQLDAERAEIEAEKQRAARAESERLAKIKAAEEAKAAAERQRLQALEETRLAAERAEAERLRLEAIRPDVERVASFVAQLRAIVPPDVQSPEARDVLATSIESIGFIAADLEYFAGHP